MSGYNKVIIIGNLGSDPEMRFTPSGKPVANFSVAVNDREETEWFSIVAWDKTAELCNQFLGKGKQVCIEGRLQTRKWEDQDGQMHYKTELVANKVVFLGKREAAQEDDLSYSEETAEKPKVEELEPDDIPF